MVLHHHTNPEALERLLIDKHISKGLRERLQTNRLSYLVSNYQNAVPKYLIAPNGLGSESAYQLVRDELTLDGNPTLNFASFVNTYVDEYASRLLTDNFTKNLADSDEYPALMEIHSSCISVLADLWNAPQETRAELEQKYKVIDEKAELEIRNNTSIGTATVGSSEAIMLGGLALKKRWQAKMRAAGKSTEHPNIIMGANAQVALEKFARYFDVEARLVPVSKESDYVLDLTKIRDFVDENTIGVFVILGSTYTGTFEDVAGVSDILDKIEEETGIDVPIHVDGASGGFFAPFIYPDLVWDFRLPRVHLINTSGHKFGLTAAGLGWILWRKSSYLPEELKFKLSYLGGTEESFTLNFLRPGHEVIQQFYNFVSLGRDGYTEFFTTLLENASLLSDFLELTKYYECVLLVNKKNGPPCLPVVAFKFTEKFQKDYPLIPQELISAMLRNKGYIIPNYPLPPNEEATQILRVVVRYNLSHKLLDKLMSDLVDCTETLMQAADLVVESTKDESPEARLDNDKVIREMLVSIATSGEKNRELLVGSFKGTC